jgi:hypothetical protein
MLSGYAQCDDTCGHSMKYTFEWNVDYVLERDRPDEFVPYKTTITILLCDKHYSQILNITNGEQPVIWGPDEDAAYEMITNAYMHSDLALDNNIHADCMGSTHCNCNCNGDKSNRNFIWRFCDRGKYSIGGSTAFRILPITFCDKHYNEILEKNNKIQPQCVGWDFWDAVDSIIA